MTTTAARPEPNPAADGGRPAPRGPVEDLRRALGHMSAAERRLRSREHTRPDELSHAQLRSIAALGREQQMTVGELAKSAELTPASVTAMLDQLEAAEIVQRHRSTEDRRVCHVSLTPVGWRLLEDKLSAWQSRWESELAHVSNDELASAVAVIERVTGIYDAVTSSRPIS